MKSKIAVVTAGHLSTCPRMLKAADALAEAGYAVEVVSTKSTDWAVEADRDIEARRVGKWRSSVVDYSRKSGFGTYLLSGIRRRFARTIASRFSTIPFQVATRAFARVHENLVSRALATGADFYYGGTTGGIAAVFEAAKRSHRPYALDLEDFHSGESDEDSLDARLAERIEREILPGARFLTTSSEAIADAYYAKYGIAPVVIHNTFPLPAEAPEPALDDDGPLRVYWFSQTIGTGRGLEEAVTALGLSGIEAELHLRGSMSQGFGESLFSLARQKAPRVPLFVHPPGLPDEMTQRCRGFDVGIALETGWSTNNRIALGNKVLTYLVAGLALVLTDLPGHRPLIQELGAAALVVPPREVRLLSEGFRRLATDRSYLSECRRASWNAATRRWHWQHPEERGRLLRLFATARKVGRTESSNSVS